MTAHDLKWICFSHMNITQFTGVIIFAIFIFTFSCSKQENTMSLQDAKDMALKYSKLMSSRKYNDAYEMTSKSFKEAFSVKEMQSSFEYMIPNDWGEVIPIEVGETMTNWPAKKLSDIAWVYVILGGDVYSEALTLIVTSEDNILKIRDVEYGRP